MSDRPPDSPAEESDPAEGLSAPPRERRPTRRTWLALGIALVLVNLVVVGGLIAARRDSSPEPVYSHRDDPTADIVAWLPRTDDARESFAAWTGDGSAVDPQLLDRLGFAPQPLTLGHSAAWKSTYGYSLSDITRWAAAGSRSPVAVLEGTFDPKLVRESLEQSGFERSTYRNVDVYVLPEPTTDSRSINGDADRAAGAVAIAGNRLITAPAFQDVRLAIDAALGGPSLADDPGVARLLADLTPVAALMAVDQREHGRDCGVDVGPGEPSGRYVAVAYLPEATGSGRQTLIATTFDNDSEAAAALPAFEAGWSESFANAGGAGGPIDTFGKMATVRQRSSTLVVELVDGQEEGWARAGIRFAIPVCETAMKNAASGSPVASGAAMSPFERAAGSLPDLGDGMTTRIVDVSTTSAARGALAPSGVNPSAEEVGQWLSAIQPLPALETLPSDANELAAWPARFGIPLDTIAAVAETRHVGSGDAAAVLIGTWDPETVATALGNLGYDSIQIGDVRHFAFVTADGAPSPRPAMWANVAIAGDRLFVGSSQRLMREILGIAIGEEPPSDAAGRWRNRMLLATPNATAAEIVPVAAVAPECGAVAPGRAAMATIWSAGDGEGDLMAIVVYPDRSEPEDTVAADLDARVRTLVIEAPHAGGSPVPVSALSAVVRYRGVERDQIPDQETMIVARFFASATGDPLMDGLFAATTGSCELFKP